MQALSYSTVCTTKEDEERYVPEFERVKVVKLNKTLYNLTPQ